MTEKLHNFNAICEAYEVLSNPELRAIYDKAGDGGVKNGIPLKRSQHTKTQGSYAYSGDGMSIFKSFHGTRDPFADNFSISQLNKEARE